ncbi:O-fucosyltransferase 7-like isoform X3 [Papaver somniferum]|uniref:O-fucosyltransferase 7-like isoform X3 n=1 Tax=Papaver somniferum TaxID=3469 RepID=UPI000E6FA177|nr:O-fucosyltransferase 7-like isoform X3 [Papaver somniferum]
MFKVFKFLNQFSTKLGIMAVSSTGHKKSSLFSFLKDRDIDKLWKAPQHKDVVACVNPCSQYSRHTKLRGYLLVHTNGELNQMRDGN